MFLVEMVRKLISQTRICPSCGHRRTTSSDGGRRDRCEKCGAPLPPARDRDATGKS